MGATGFDGTDRVPGKHTEVHRLVKQVELIVANDYNYALAA